MWSHRRSFVRNLLVTPSVAAAAAAAAVAPESAEPQERRDEALDIRRQTARAQRDIPAVPHISNGEDEAYPNRIASFSKGLVHNHLGEVNRVAYDSLLHALSSGKVADVEAIPRGFGRVLVNPLAGYAYSLEGADPQRPGAPPAPLLSSAEAASEMIELYWQALARDVPFDEYESNPITLRAAEELSGLTAFRGPRVSRTSGDHPRSRTGLPHSRGLVTPATLFRGNLPGDLRGPYLSQFLWKPVPYLSGVLEQRYRTPLAGNDFMTGYNEWLQSQSGVLPTRKYAFDPVLRYIRNGRDLAEAVHYDFLYQLFLHAGLILLDYHPDSTLGFKNYFAETNPYKHSTIQTGFVTFGVAQVTDWLARVTTASLKATWCQKWLVHRRLRPEATAGRLYHTRGGTAAYPLHATLLESAAVDETEVTHRSSLLPQAYPEGSPLHPAYPAGHATVAGACATVLKALFDENALVPNCVVPNADGTSLIPRGDLALTVGDEINKLAYNVPMGRNFAGIHYRTDSESGLRIGEAVTISFLQDMIMTLPEDFEGFQFTSFEGYPVHITRL